MAITLTPVKTYVVGDRRRVIQDITLDSSYPTGGYPLTATQLGCDIELNDVHVNQGAGGLLFTYDYTNSKLKAMLPTGGGGTGTLGAPTYTATAANAVVPAGATPVTSTGAQPTLTVTQPTIAANPGIAAEVPNTTNLSTVTVRVVATGKGTQFLTA